MPEKRFKDINIRIAFDDDLLTDEIHWNATDNKQKIKKSKAMFLSLWDPEEDNTYKIDLWTKDMYIGEMKKFFYQTLMTMADTLEKSTNEKNMAEDLRDYCNHFAEKLKVFEEK